MLFAGSTIRRGVKQNLPVDGFVAESPVPKTQVADEVFLVWQVLGHTILKAPNFWKYLIEMVHHQGLEPGTP